VNRTALVPREPAFGERAVDARPILAGIVASYGDVRLALNRGVRADIPGPAATIHVKA
jgi:hypothetical protein